jgi:DNA-binding HxlR family transcriptional regulator
MTAQPGGETFCGVAAAVTLLGDAWTLLIVRDLAGGPHRFGELHTSTGISVRVLTDRLRAMGEAGLLTRHMYPEIPPRVEYELTEKGYGAVAVVAALREYGETWLHPTREADREASLRARRSCC